MKMTDNTVRLDKYVATLGLASRRGVEKLLLHNNLTVNGQRITEPGTRIHFHDTILLNGKHIQKPNRVYYLLNKPKRIISTAADEFGRANVTHLIHSKERIFPVGRLDRDTTGLILLTNDGELTNLLTHPRYHIPKIYELVIRGTVLNTQLEPIRTGVILEDGKTAPARARITGHTPTGTKIEVTLFEGKKRQIRRMCEVLGLPLLSLTRISMGPLTLDGLKEGEYRKVSKKEIEQLKNLALKTVKNTTANKKP